MFNKLLELVTKCAVEYKFKSAQTSITAEAREKFAGYASDFELLRKEIKRLEPKPITFDGEFKCPVCGGKLNMICDAAEESKERLEFCPWCGQALDAYSEL